MTQAQRIFVTGIGTGVGKTMTSAVLARVLHADYWKPLNCGSAEPSDRAIVKSLLGKEHKGLFHPERYALRLPQSPHLAAKAEGINIKLSDFSLPITPNNLIVEGAGGCLVPLNERDYMIDLARVLGLSIVLVMKNYLGCFNHTLLSIETLQRRNLKLLGLVLSGDDPLHLSDFVTKKTGLPLLGVLPQMPIPNAEAIKLIAQNWREDESFTTRLPLSLASLHPA